MIKVRNRKRVIYFVLVIGMALLLVSCSRGPEEKRFLKLGTLKSQILGKWEADESYEEVPWGLYIPHTIEFVEDGTGYIDKTKMKYMITRDYFTSASKEKTDILAIEYGLLGGIEKEEYEIRLSKTQDGKNLLALSTSYTSWGGEEVPLVVTYNKVR